MGYQVDLDYRDAKTSGDNILNQGDIIFKR